jgi:hypothetical protein
MLLDDTYHDWMHQPLELPPVVSESQPRKPRRRKRKSGYKRGERRGHEAVIPQTLVIFLVLMIIFGKED